MSLSTLQLAENTLLTTRKRFASMSEDSNSQMSNSKRQCVSWYVTLESEESLLCASSDTESVYSLQGKETEIAKDTSDTSDYSSNDEHSPVEYDPVSLSEDEAIEDDMSSSGTDDDMVVTAAAIGAAIAAAAEKDAWVTDGEDNTDSDDLDIDLSVDVSVFKPGYGRCIQCKSQNQNPLFRFCEKCFQIRKTFFPPRPRGHRQRTVSSKPSSTTTTTLTITKIDSPQSCISSSQDSGIMSQETRNSFNLSFVSPESPEKIKLKPGDDADSDNDQSEATLPEKTDDILNVVNSSQTKSETRNGPPRDDLCIICTNKPKNGIFVHGTKGHICSCYTCAVKIFNKNKRCPVCNCKIKNVLKAFTL